MSEVMETRDVKGMLSKMTAAEVALLVRRLIEKVEALEKQIEENERQLEETNSALARYQRGSDIS